MATPAGRISVLIAGNVYVKRALVRRFLEDDGYEVVGDVVDPEVVVPAILAGRPDAVLLDEDLTRRGLTIDQIRAASPDIRVVAFTSVSPGEGTPPIGADGYLTKGVGLSAVTSTLRRLFAEPFKPVLVGAAASGAAGLAVATATGEAAGAPEAEHGRDWHRYLA
ncbi:MAG TPA: hypothetical protein VFT80_15435, partial [Actinomycetota bacterium]|nr:hypothetical protein [Actinomycetota bacterium]